MVQHRESSESRFECLIVCIEGRREHSVEVWRKREGVVGFIDRVGEVERDDGDVDAFVVADVTGGSALGHLFTGAGYKAVVETEGVAGDQL